MKSGRGILAGALLAALLPGILRAQGLTRIDFDGLPLGTRVDAQYLGLGLRVLGLPVIDTVPIAHSGRHVLVAVSPLGLMGANVVAPGSLALGFVRPQAFVDLWVSGRSRIQGTMRGVVQAYDAAGQLLVTDGPRLLDPRATTTRFSINFPNARVSSLRVQAADSTSDGLQPALAVIGGLEFAATPERAVPDLAKRSLTDVRRALRDSGFLLGAVRRASKDLSKRWIVSGQSIPPGELRPPGTAVNVEVTAVRPPPSPHHGTATRTLFGAVLLAAVLIALTAATSASLRLRWRVRTEVDAGMDSLHTRLTSSEAADWQLRLVANPDDGVQRLTEQP